MVAGIRTPQQITKIGSQRWAERAGISEEERVAKYPSMEEAMRKSIKSWMRFRLNWKTTTVICKTWNLLYKKEKLWFLQTRNGKRTGAAMVKIAMDLLRQGMIDEKDSVETL